MGASGSGRVLPVGSGKAPGEGQGRGGPRVLGDLTAFLSVKKDGSWFRLFLLWGASGPS